MQGADDADTADPAKLLFCPLQPVLKDTAGIFVKCSDLGPVCGTDSVGGFWCFHGMC